MTVSDIIELLGGRSAVRDYTGWPYTTIDSWISTKHVPIWRTERLIEMAVRDGKALSVTDFPPVPERKKRETREAA